MRVIIDIDDVYCEMYKDFNNQDLSTGELAIKNGIQIPDNATNGDVIMAIFPYIDIADCDCGSGKGLIISYGDMENIFGKGMPVVDRDWWNAPFDINKH